MGRNGELLSVFVSHPGFDVGEKFGPGCDGGLGAVFVPFRGFGKYFAPWD